MMDDPSNRMQTFELDAEQEPFFNHQSEGIGGLITKYNLLGSGPRSQEGRTRSWNIPPILQELGQSRLFQKALLGIIGFAVLIHLAFDSGGGTATTTAQWESDSLEINESVPTEPQQPYMHSTANQDSVTHISMHPPSTQESPAESYSQSHGTANQESESTPLPIVKVPAAHSFTFGGMKNKGHNDAVPETVNPKATEGENLDEEILEDIEEKMKPWDLSQENYENEQGYYLHDPLRSPFASYLYAADEDVLEQRQQDYEVKLEEVKTLFGQWEDPPEAHVSGQIDFDAHKFRDVPLNVFQELDNDNCWQNDKAYLHDFLDQAEALVDATLEGIRSEYGQPEAFGPEKFPFDVIIDNYEVFDGSAVHHETTERLAGVAYLPPRTWHGLVRKLLHSMITEDYFYVVVAGKADTYGANNMAQTQIMQFNHIMEPIFHKLGMTLISRNMGMDASTAISALGGADIYGQADILWHVQDADAEEKHGESDLLHRQMILAGERVPIILSSNTDELTLASKGTAWVGNLQPGKDMCKGAGKEVSACQHLECDDDADSQCYNSVCWETRSDWNPQKIQLDKVGSPVKGCPGNRHHQMEGRKMALLLLHALKSAIDSWRRKLNTDDKLPLDPSLWHVQEPYSEIQQSVMTLSGRAPGEGVGLSASCELFLKGLDPRICHIPMHAFTEWTPRVVPRKQSLMAMSSNLIHGSDAGDASGFGYSGPDIVPLAWQIPQDEMDVHLIAIASASSQLDYGDVELLSRDDDKFTRRLTPSAREKQREFFRTSHSLAEADQSPLSPRSLEAITEGSGWRLEDAPVGFCDGSAQSRCNRTEDNACILANHNHYKGSLVGSSQNGWLVMSLPEGRYGVILARLEFDRNSPDDLVLEYSVNGESKSVPKQDLESFRSVVIEDLLVYPLLLEKVEALTRYKDEMKYELALRIRSKDDPDYEFRLSHVYFG